MTSKKENSGLIECDGYFFHETSVIDAYADVGTGTKIWHFTHVSSNSEIGDNCSLGQNVYVAPKVVLGNNVKVQNNVSIFTGVTCADYVFLGTVCQLGQMPKAKISISLQLVRTLTREIVWSTAKYLHKSDMITLLGWDDPDNMSELYEEYLRQPWFNHNKPSIYFDENRVVKRLLEIFS